MKNCFKCDTPMPKNALFCFHCGIKLEDMPATEENTTKEPSTEESVAEEPLAEKSVAEESTAEEPLAEESVAEESTAEEPLAEESVAEESTAEESTAEEPLSNDDPILDFDDFQSVLKNSWNAFFTELKKAISNYWSNLEFSEKFITISSAILLVFFIIALCTGNFLSSFFVLLAFLFNFLFKTKQAMSSVLSV